MSKAPEKISKLNEKLLNCKWDDGFEATINFKSLREKCPCAYCTSEEDIKPKACGAMLQGMDELKYIIDRLTPVGNYAIRAEWADGHHAGIYTWDKWRRIFEKNGLSNKEVQKICDEENVTL